MAEGYVLKANGVEVGTYESLEALVAAAKAKVIAEGDFVFQWYRGHLRWRVLNNGLPAAGGTFEELAAAVSAARQLLTVFIDGDAGNFGVSVEKFVEDPNTPNNPPGQE